MTTHTVCLFAGRLAVEPKASPSSAVSDAEPRQRSISRSFFEARHETYESMGRPPGVTCELTGLAEQGK
jgi:hypothetical protein